MSSSDPVPEESGANQYGSAQRSMEIFWSLTNLSLEWSMVCFMGSFVSSAEQEEYWDKMHKKMADSLLDTIKSLKGCWVKLGQFLSTKSGILPSCYLEAFSQLQDYMPCSDFSEIMNTIETDLGYMDEIYKNFDSIPLSSASIAQVHRAVLYDGRVVAIKVQHKSSKQNLMNDIEVLKMILGLMNSAGFSNNIRDYLDEYESYALKELDFTVETQNMEYAHDDVKHSKVPIKVPYIIKKFCSKRVITMEYIDLHKFTDSKFVEKYRVNLNSIMYDVHDYSLYQALFSGRFHCDPHPGNLQLTLDRVNSRVYPVFLDWGFTTYLNISQRINLSIMYRSIHNNDPLGYLTALIDSGFILISNKSFKCEIFFQRLISIILLPYIKMLDGDFKRTSQDALKLHEKILVFITEYFAKFPNYFPLSFKVLSEYQAICVNLGVSIPLFHLIYKNASYSLYELYNTPVTYYFKSECGMSLLHQRLYKTRVKLNNKYSCSNLLNKLLNHSLSINDNLSLKSNFVFSKAKSLLESKLSSLLHYLCKDRDNLIACQICVVRDNIVEAEMSFGNIGRYELRPISNDCLFSIPGLMFGILSTIILHLSSIGKIDIYDPICIYWPEFRINGKKSIKIVDVLNHNTGIKYAYDKFPRVDYFIRYENICKSLEKAHVYPEDTNKTSYNFIYSGFILSEIIKKATGTEADVYITELVKMMNVDELNFIFPNRLYEGMQENDIIVYNSDAEDVKEVTGDTEHKHDITEHAADVPQGTEKDESYPTDNVNVSAVNFNSGTSDTNEQKTPGNSEAKTHLMLGEMESEVNNGSKENLQKNAADDTSLSQSPKLLFIGDEDVICAPTSLNPVVAPDIPLICLETQPLDQSTSNTNCYCFVESMPPNESKQTPALYRRCMIPTTSCPMPYRFVKSFRGTADDAMNVAYPYETTDAPLEPVVFDESICQILQDANCDEIKARRKRVLNARGGSAKDDDDENSTRTCVGYTNADAIIYGGLLLDPSALNYELVYKNYIPAINCKLNASSLSRIYNSILNGSIDEKYLDEIMNNSHYDDSLLSRVFIGLHLPCWSLGFQKFVLYNAHNKSIIYGFGNSDSSGSVALVIPKLNITIALLVSHYNKQSVTMFILQLILKHYGLELINNLSAQIYKILSNF